ncbi:MAG: hypothetical protein RXR41_00260 [Candidatus Marsarchaeota archaeon]
MEKVVWRKVNYPDLAGGTFWISSPFAGGLHPRSARITPYPYLPLRHGPSIYPSTYLIYLYAFVDALSSRLDLGLQEKGTHQDFNRSFCT